MITEITPMQFLASFIFSIYFLIALIYIITQSYSVKSLKKAFANLIKETANLIKYTLVILFIALVALLIFVSVLSVIKRLI